MFGPNTLLLMGLLEEVRKLRGEVSHSYCECCGYSSEWEPDPDYGTYVRWTDFEGLIKEQRTDE